MAESNEGVCIVTQPHRNRSTKDHTHDLANIIAELTPVSILTANLPADAPIRNEHDVIEYSSKGTGEHFFIEAIRFVWNQIRLCSEILRREEDIVLFFGPTAYVLPVIFSRLVGKTVLILPRANIPLSLQLRWEESLPTSVAKSFAESVSLLEHINFEVSNGIITYSPSMADQLGLSRYENKLYPNGARFIDTDAFDIQIPHEERSNIVGFVGRLDIEKRIPVLAEVARELPDDIRFYFVGDGDYRELLEEELSAEIAQGSVKITGRIERDSVPELLNKLRLLVLPSHPTEGLPTVILEAMACGTPAYATPVSGVPDVVRNGETGFHMESVETEKIAVEIETILDRDDLDTISQNARELIEEKYSFDTAVYRYAEILNSVETGVS